MSSCSGALDYSRPRRAAACLCCRQPALPPRSPTFCFAYTFAYLLLHNIAPMSVVTRTPGRVVEAPITASNNAGCKPAGGNVACVCRVITVSCGRGGVVVLHVCLAGDDNNEIRAHAMPFAPQMPRHACRTHAPLGWLHAAFASEWECLVPRQWGPPPPPAGVVLCLVTGMLLRSS